MTRTRRIVTWFLGLWRRYQCRHGRHLWGMREGSWSCCYAFWKEQDYEGDSRMTEPVWFEGNLFRMDYLTKSDKYALLQTWGWALKEIEPCKHGKIDEHIADRDNDGDVDDHSWCEGAGLDA